MDARPATDALAAVALSHWLGMHVPIYDPAPCPYCRAPIQCIGGRFYATADAEPHTCAPHVTAAYLPRYVDGHFMPPAR